MVLDIVQSNFTDEMGTNNQLLLSTEYRPGAVLNPGDAEINKMFSLPSRHSPSNGDQRSVSRIVSARQLSESSK